ncbi:uncharacterized protein LOC113793758 [Dermatophagoides pteronyssinus]|uniref:uncharacterized protein LOC113793758 n=1 Tax=Dermatophagoides pteronyssinus TaxID=6956 RepID=UPI003F674C43
MLIIKIFSILRKWFWPNVVEYFKQIDLLINGLHRDHNMFIIRFHSFIINYLRWESLRYLIYYLAPLTFEQRLLIFDPSINMILINTISMKKNPNKTIFSTINLSTFEQNYRKQRKQQNENINFSEFIIKRFRLHLLRRNLEMCSMLLFGIYFPLRQIYLHWNYFFNPNHSICFGIMKALIQQSIGSSAFFAGLIVFYMAELLSTFILGFEWIIRLNYQQISKHLDYWPIDYLDIRLVRQFLVDNCHLFLFIDNVVRSYSRLFLIFLLYNWPINIYLIGSLFRLHLTQKHNPYQESFMILLFLQECFGIFWIHYICTKYSKHIHYGCGIRKLFRLNTIISVISTANELKQQQQQQQRPQQPKLSLSLRIQWKLCHFIEKFHTNNHYGFSYGKYGIIGLKNFIRLKFNVWLIYFSSSFMIAYNVSDGQQQQQQQREHFD